MVSSNCSVVSAANLNMFFLRRFALHIKILDLTGQTRSCCFFCPIDSKCTFGEHVPALGYALCAERGIQLGGPQPFCCTSLPLNAALLVFCVSLCL